LVFFKSHLANTFPKPKYSSFFSHRKTCLFFTKPGTPVRDFVGGVGVPVGVPVGPLGVGVLWGWGLDINICLEC